MILTVTLHYLFSCSFPKNDSSINIDTENTYTIVDTMGTSRYNKMLCQIDRFYLKARYVGVVL